MGVSFTWLLTFNHPHISFVLLADVVRAILSVNEVTTFEIYFENYKRNLFDFCFTALRHILCHFGRGQLT